MEMELKNMSQVMGISLRDARIIYDIIEHFSNEGYSKLKFHLLTIFREDIKPEHYIVLGHLIGYCLATSEANEILNKQTLCLRQN